MYICTCIYIYLSLSIYICVCVCVCVYVYIYIYIDIDIDICIYIRMLYVHGQVGQQRAAGVQLIVQEPAEAARRLSKHARRRRGQAHR